MLVTNTARRGQHQVESKRMGFVFMRGGALPGAWQQYRLIIQFAGAAAPVQLVASAEQVFLAAFTLPRLE